MIMLVLQTIGSLSLTKLSAPWHVDLGRESSSGARHQQPEVNYLPRFSPQLIFLEYRSLRLQYSREIDYLENLNIVHITLLVADPMHLGARTAERVQNVLV